MGIATHLNDRIMIVDDLPNMRADLVKILTDMGFTNMKEMPDGKAAFEELKREAQAGKASALLFVDINMPFMNGIDLLKALRFMDSYKKTPVFIVSTENEKDIIINAILNGATDYIIKPYNPAIVKDKLLTLFK
jgi:two-component system chemotaxis response regulator CheY